MRATIRDVAQLAGVSVATVSRVLNHPSSVHEETRKRVLEAIHASGYTYNAVARSLSTRKTLTIGVIVPAITNPVFALSTRGIQEVSNAHGYSILLGNSNYSDEAEERLIEVFKEKRVEGILFTCSNLRHPYLQRLKESRFPFVLLYNTPFDPEINFVSIDNHRAAYEITRYLIALGHRRIGVISGFFKVSDRSLARWKGFQACLKDHRVRFPSELHVETELSFEGGRKAMERLLQVKPRLTAVFCSNDFIAMGAMKALREKGMRIPEDVSIAGFDDIEMASYFEPALTTIHQPAYEMGQQAATLLLRVLSGETKSPQHILLDHKLITRDSCGPPGQTWKRGLKGGRR